MLSICSRLDQSLPLCSPIRLFILTIAVVTLSAALAQASPHTHETLTVPASIEPTHWPDWLRYGGSEEAEFGYSVAGIGDVNSDGFRDVVVGSPYFSGTLSEQGRAEVFYGSSTGLSASPAWSAVGGSADAAFGASVANAGDINGDGKDDVIIGEPKYYDGSNVVGRAQIYVTTVSGLATAPAWTVEGPEDWSYFGDAVAGVEDVNGDTYDDVLVGAWGVDVGVDGNVGCAYLYFGTASGIQTTPGWESCGVGLDARFGSSLAPAGDVNGDNTPDFIVGAPDTFGANGRAGAAYVYLGASPAPLATPSWTVESDKHESLFGAAVASAGDVNLDSFDDVIVGAPWYDASQEGAGRVFVYAGSLTGLSTEPLWTVDGDMEYASLGTSVGHGLDALGQPYVVVGAPGYSGYKQGEGRVLIYEKEGTSLGDTPTWAAAGVQSGAWFGSSLAVQDINGDVRNDVIVGAPDHSDSFRWEGALLAYHGGTPSRSPFLVNSSADGTDAEDVIRGDGLCLDTHNRCTLRAAIQETNSLIGPDRVTFISPMMITVSDQAGALPPVVDQLVLDGSGTWGGPELGPGVVLLGDGGAYDGLRIQGDGSAVLGLGVTGFFGTGIVVSAANCTVGGPELGQRNVIVNNVNEGVTLIGDQCHHNVVQSNYIGVGSDGLTESPNNSGIWVTAGATENVIGGISAARRNVISGNTAEGVAIDGDGTSDNYVIGNYIGLAADGVTLAGNVRGVSVTGGSMGNGIGWGLDSIGDQSSTTASILSIAADADLVEPRRRLMAETHRALGRPLAPIYLQPDDEPSLPSNVIAGNDWEGVRITGEGSGTLVAGNSIRDNGLLGVVIEDQTDVTVEQNMIENNGGPGVLVNGAAAKRVWILGNSIRSNDGKGIELAGGANGGIAPPSIIDADETHIAGVACSLCQVEIFSDNEDEGWIPEARLEADVDGNWTWSTTFTGPYLTATQSNTDDGTSEFSSPWMISTPPTATASATASVTATATATETITATATSTITVTPTVTATATGTATVTATATITATASVTTTTTATATASPSAGSPEPSVTPTPSAMQSPQATSTPSASPTPEPSTTQPTETTTPASEASRTPSPASTAVPTDTATPTDPPTFRIFAPIVMKLYRP